MMWTVDHSKREQWMPAWPDKVTGGASFVAFIAGRPIGGFPTMEQLLDHFMMPRSALVEA